MNELPTSAAWAAPGFTLQAIPGLGGYLLVDYPGVTSAVDVAGSDTVAAMFATVPTFAGRDQNDLVLVDHDGESWARYGSTVARPLDGVPALVRGDRPVAADAEGYAAWFAVPAGGRLQASDGVPFKVYDEEFRLLPGDLVPSGGYVVVLPGPGQRFTVLLR